MVSTDRSRRAPAWSGRLTSHVASAIPVDQRPAALLAIQAIHTVIFASVGMALTVFVTEGLRGRAGRRAVGSLSVVLGETAVYISNNQVCPLTPVAEELGAASGGVADLFLPDWASRRIPLVSGSALLLGLVLFARARAGGRQPDDAYSVVASRASAAESAVRPPSTVQTAPVT